MKAVRFLSATALAGFALALPTNAFAQSTPTAEQCASDPQLTGCGPANADGSSTTAGEAIIVTGSRIARPTLSSPVPVTSVDAGDLLSGGDLNVGDALNDLPSLRSTFSQSNSTRFIGTAGLNALDLRGLGTDRTLVLVNGRRHVTASAGSSLVDVNTIPGELLERVDVVTGGNSAVYGSDAIAGVVNFVLKRNYDGIRLTGQGGISERGDRGAYFGALTFGRNFADGRGNIAVALEYSKQNPIKFTGRDYLTGAFSGRKQFNLNEPTAGEPAAGDGVIDNAFFTNIRNNNISDGGLLTAVCGVGNVADPTRCSPGSNATTRFGSTYVFQPDGSLILNPITRDLRFVGSNNSVGGLGSTLSNYGDLFPGLERLSANLLAHFDVSDAFTPFVEAKFTRLIVDSEGSPSFFQGSIPGFYGGGNNLRCDNPFLTTQAFTTLQSIGRCGAVPDATTFTISRNNVDQGIRGEHNVRDTFRIVGGIEGRFNDDWKYEVAVNYGQLNSRTVSTNNQLDFNSDFSDGPFLKAIDVTRNAAGQIVCRVNAVTVTDPACVPLNLFGSGNASPAALKYAYVDSLFTQKASQFVASAFVSGDLSQLFELPGGPVGFAIGGEYREETGQQDVDDNTSQGLTFLTALQPVHYPELTVKDAYGEIRIPILKDMPFFQSLEINGAARVSDYNNSTGTVYSYNGSVVWSPINDIKFRAGYARAVRAPTQSDLFDPQGQNFAQINDPCDTLYINTGTTTRAANCAAAGVPVGFVNTDARAQTLSFAQGGNPTLRAERSDSYTFGAVLEPRFVPGLSITIDYYNIRVSNLIATLGAQTILNLCYDSATLNNQYCQLVNRLPDSTFDDPFVISGPVNFAKQQARGIDIDMAYSKKFENGDRFTYRVIGTYKLTLNNFTDPTAPNVANRQLSELGDPQYEFSASAAYKHDIVEGRVAVRYVGPQTIGVYEAQNSFDGNPPQNADQFPQVYYPSVTYTDLRLTLDVTSKYRFAIGVDNVFDVKPPFGQTGLSAGGAIFDTTGRYMYASIRADF